VNENSLQHTAYRTTPLVSHASNIILKTIEQHINNKTEQQRADEEADI